jgi:hypothetical protein
MCTKLVPVPGPKKYIKHDPVSTLEIAQNNNGPTFFAKLIFSPPKLFGILEMGNLSEQKKFGGKKSTWQKSFSQ